MITLRITLWTLIAVLPLAAQDVPRAASPESVGLSSERLERINDVFQAHVDEGRIAGAVAMVLRNGKLAYSQQWGMRDIAAHDPLQPDDIFRIYSMTKPIVSVALMTLFEEGRFFLNEPVARYLPEFAGLRVARLDDNPPIDAIPTEAAVRPVTIQDLLRHTSGLTYGLFSNTAVDRLYRRANMLEGTTADLVTKLSGIPLLTQPGTKWIYSVSTDVAGRLIEVLSGVPLDEFLEERIFHPLGMRDTGFYAPAEKHDRLARLYGHAEKDTLVPQDSTEFLSRPTFLSGGGGLVGTAPDYARFALMLRGGGELDGTRILSSKTVELMTVDHLGDVAGPGQGWGFGLGFAVREVAGLDGTAGSVGEYYWAGLAGTRFWIDPEEDLIGIFMIQILPNRSVNFREQFKGLVYQSIIN